MTEIQDLCVQYLDGKVTPNLFDALVSGYTSHFSEPGLSTMLRSVERSIGEHRCWFWKACELACCFEGNEELWAEKIKDADALFPLIESDANN